MSRRWMLVLSVFVPLPYTALADGLLHQYEGNVVPYDESGGWLMGDPCEPPCAESVEDGHFVLFLGRQQRLRHQLPYYRANSRGLAVFIVGPVAVSFKPRHRPELLHLRREIRRHVCGGS